MEIKTTKRFVEIEDKVYIAEDGKEFDSLDDCEKYENELEKEHDLKAISTLELEDLRDLPPLDTDAQYINDNHSFYWYMVTCEKEYKAVKKVREGNWGDWSAPVSYPEIICVEIDEAFDPDDSWMHKLSDMKNSTIGFWERFGYSVEFKAIKELI